MPLHQYRLTSRTLDLFTYLGFGSDYGCVLKETATACELTCEGLLDEQDDQLSDGA